MVKIMMRSNGLKGQQRSAQGSALGKREAQHSPCKGKRTIAGHRPAITLLPFQGGGCLLVITQGVLSPLRYESVSYRRRAALG